MNGPVALDPFPEPLFDPDLRRQACHDRDDFEPYSVTIASPEFPCGASWLASCLFELGLPLWKPWGIADRLSWEPLGDRRFRYRFPGSGWSRLVAGLVDGREMQFAAGPVPRFTHAWPGQLPATPRCILFVRDPRDTLRSDWLRARRSGRIDAALPLEAWLSTPVTGLGIDRRSWLALYWASWLHAAEAAQCRIVRFEDSKRDPAGVLDAVLRFIGADPPPSARAQALAASTHAALVQAEQRLIAIGTVSTPVLGDGGADPHRHWPASQQPAIDDGLRRVFARLGYRLDAGGPTAPTADLDITALHAALAVDGCADPASLAIALEAARALRGGTGDVDQGAFDRVILAAPLHGPRA